MDNLPSTFPITVHNATNDDLFVRYMRGDGMGRGEIRIGPRDNKLLVDAFVGMKMYASNSFDPSTAYATLGIEREMDDVHFTDSAGGYGRGPSAAPDIMVGQNEQERQRRKARMAKKNAAVHKEKERAAAEKMLPGDGSADTHGTSLHMAHASDLTNQGGTGLGTTGEGGGGAGAAQDDRIFVPGMGYMQREAIPPHVLEQLLTRQRAQEEAGIQEQSGDAVFPDYDQQKIAMQMDGTTLPPVQLVRNQRSSSNGVGVYNGRLWAIERAISGKLMQYTGCSAYRSERLARLVFILIVGCSVVALAFWWSRWKKQQLQKTHENAGERRSFRRRR